MTQAKSAERASARVRWAGLLVACWTWNRLPWRAQMALWRSRWYALALHRNRNQNYADYIGVAKYER